jgi:hypothetical protein
MAELDAEFVADAQKIAAAELERRGIDSSTKPSAQRVDALTRLLSVEHRLIPPRRRETVWSDALQLRTSHPQLGAVHRIAAESESGLDVSHYLGRGVRKAEPDGQLNDWGIAHLHLGARQPGQMLSRGTKDLLFVVATVDRLHLVDLGDHSSFVDHELFEVLHRNWPELVADSRARNVVPGSSSLSPERQVIFRRAGFVTLTQTQDGTIYTLNRPGFSGDSVS